MAAYHPDYDDQINRDSQQDPIEVYLIVAIHNPRSWVEPLP